MWSASASVRSRPTTTACLGSNARVRTRDDLPAVVRLRSARRAGARDRERLWRAAARSNTGLSRCASRRASNALTAVVLHRDAAASSVAGLVVIDAARTVRFAERADLRALPASTRDELTAVVRGCSARLRAAGNRRRIRDAPTRALRIAADACVAPSTVHGSIAVVSGRSTTERAPVAVRHALALSCDALFAFAAVRRACTWCVAVVARRRALVSARDRVRLRGAYAHVATAAVRFVHSPLVTKARWRRSALGERRMRRIEVDARDHLAAHQRGADER